MHTRLAALGLALSLASCGGATEPTPPSIILVSLDTLRGDRVGFMGYERDTTPNLDALAAQSAWFSRALSTSCWTLSSHMGMLTGLYPEQHGVVVNDACLNPDIPTLAQRLSDRGYVTVGLYEYGWIDPRHGFDRGFDVFRPHQDAEQAGAHLAEELEGLGGERPFFLFLHLFDIHADPLLSDQGVFYDPPPPFDRTFREDAPEALTGIDFRRALEEPGLLDADQLDALAAMYDGGIRYTDRKLGEWLLDWRERGLLDRAVLVVTADHGEALGQREGGLDNHGGMFQEALRVPLLVRMPDGAHAGRRLDRAVNQVDLLPTFLALSGAAPDPRLPGYPLFDPRPASSVMAASQGRQFALVQWPWKIKGSDEGVRLFHLEEDPLELRPLELSDPRARAAYDAMKADFQRERRALAPLDAPPQVAQELTAEALERLKAIGYAAQLEDD